MTNRFRTPAILLIPLLLSGVQRAPGGDDLFELKKNFEIFGSLYEQIAVNYVEAVRPQPLMRTGINAMMDDLDPYTRFYDQADNVEMRRIQSRGIATVGLQIGIRAGSPTILFPDERADAYRQGVQVGDRLISIDRTEVSGLSISEIVDLLGGDEGSTVRVELLRTGVDGPMVFMLKRTLPSVRNVAWAGYLYEDSVAAIGYVRLNQFGPGAAREVRRLLRGMNRSSSGLKGVILDLRDNPGGILGEAVELVGLFVPSGTTVVSTRGRTAGSTQTYPSKREPSFPTVPVSVLVNRFSASASEIVAGALQDLDRAVIVGETTFGKGLVQIVQPLPYNTSLKITIAHYYTPQGRDLQSWKVASSRSAPVVSGFKTRSGRPVRSGSGIEPDLEVTRSTESEMEASLLRTGVFFRFADMFAAELRDDPTHAAPTSLSDLPNDEDLMVRFRNWVAQERIDYKIDSETLIDSLSVVLARSNYAGAVPILDRLRASVRSEKSKDYERYKDNLLRRIREEVMTHFMSGTELLKDHLTRDEGVTEARQIIASTERYTRLLGLN